MFYTYSPYKKRIIRVSEGSASYMTLKLGSILFSNLFIMQWLEDTHQQQNKESMASTT